MLQCTLFFAQLQELGLFCKQKINDNKTVSHARNDNMR